jgi:GTP-binding protein
MSSVDFQQATFLISVAHLKQLPVDHGKEVAFIGCSNAGKSSTINTLTGIKGLAKTSKTPGRTQQLNYFELSSSQRLVDLPGYGFAKVPQATKARWEQLVNRYLEQRRSLQGLVIIMDIRHPMKPDDEHLLHWSSQCDLPVHVLLNKADKLGYGAQKNQSLAVQKALAAISPDFSCQLFSSHLPLGVSELRQHLARWLA